MGRGTTCQFGLTTREKYFREVLSNHLSQRTSSCEREVATGASFGGHGLDLIATSQAVVIYSVSAISAVSIAIPRVDVQRTS